MSKILPPNTIYDAGDPFYSGKFPIRTEITVLEPDEVGTNKRKIIVITSINTLINRKKRIGWAIKEVVGVGAYNSKALEKLASENVIKKTCLFESIIKRIKKSIF